MIAAYGQRLAVVRYAEPGKKGVHAIFVEDIIKSKRVLDFPKGAAVHRCTAMN